MLAEKAGKPSLSGSVVQWSRTLEFDSRDVGSTPAGASMSILLAILAIVASEYAIRAFIAGNGLVFITRAYIIFVCVLYLVYRALA